MKKIITSALVILMLAATVFVLTGCGENGGGSTSSNPLVGSWKYSTGDYTYTFNEDGTGDYNAAGTKMEFTYTTEGSKISILYTGNTVPFETEYSIEGDTLNVIDSLGNDTLYKKVK